MSLHNVRQNETSFALLAPHFPAYRAGQFSLQRQMHMHKARELKQKKSDPFLVSMFADFARDSHRHYLKSLLEIRRELQASMRIQTYEQTFVDRVMGVLHR